MENVRSPQKKAKMITILVGLFFSIVFFGDWAKHWIFWQYPYGPCMTMYAIFTYI